MSAAPVLRVATCCLAEDIQYGDVLVDAGLGGEFDGEVVAVRVGPDRFVYVDLLDAFGKSQRFCFTRMEMLGVLRARR